MTRAERPVAPRPWYRHIWPWLLFTPPAVAVIAGTVTMVIAFKTFDGVVSDDYYQEGRAINRSLERDTRASERGISAQLLFNPSGDQVRVTIAGEVAPAEQLRLRLVRAARSGDDQDVDLQAVAPGVYAGRLTASVTGRWHLQLEDRGLRWRIATTVQLPESGPIGLAPPQAARTGQQER